MSFLTDVFHPLVQPLTTYTYYARDIGRGIVSSGDEDHLPPGGLNLRFGFPDRFKKPRDNINKKDDATTHAADGVSRPSNASPRRSSAPLTIEILQYMHVVFDTEAVLDTVPLEDAANTGAWHAWRSYRSKALGDRLSPPLNAGSGLDDSVHERSSSPRQQPGGARRPAEWNWQGVWEDRVKKSIQASISDHVLYHSDPSELICFSKMESEAIGDTMLK